MPVFLLPILKFLGSKAGLYMMAFIAVLIAGFVLIEHERAVGAQGEKDAQTARDAQYIAGVVTQLKDLQAYYAPYVVALDNAEKARAAQESEIVRLSAADDGRNCINAAGVDRLLKLRQHRGGQIRSKQPAR